MWCDFTIFYYTLLYVLPYLGDFTIFFNILQYFAICGVILLYFTIFWMWGEEHPRTVAAILS